ncbi:MAG TPA: ATP-dependent Clp protease adaptor ClpS [Candidatus Kapabacteria bacterium]|nr:ATP-dependent Clp protease adaptor ClpS [Candidatus Kapabacteria bacterium]
MIDELVEPEVIDEVSTINITTFSSKVVLYNDEWHTFDEVISQIIKATGKSYKLAEQLTLQVHNDGKAIVYEGDMNACLKVSSILEEISLHTQIEY